MDENYIIKKDLEAVIEGIKKLGPKVQGVGFEDPARAKPPAVLVIDCVLSLNRSYDNFVVPRIEKFMEQHPDIQSVIDLRDLIVKYPTSHDFMHQELNFDYEERANTLLEVVEFLSQIIQKASYMKEDEALKQWAIQAKPEGYQTLNIRGFGIAGFQYLRMLFGADTSKPDVHIIRFVSNLINRNVLPIEAVKLLEAASATLNLSVRDVDTYIWEISARGMQDSNVPDISDTAITEKTTVEFSKFWAPIHEENGVFAGKPIRNKNAISTTIRNIQVWLILNKNHCYIRLYFLKPNHFERRDKMMQLFSESDYNYEYKDTASLTTVIFPVLEKGKNDRDDWDEIREKLVSMGTDIYNKIDESGL